MYSTLIAYLLWFVSGFGALGLHRFYLGKPLSGILYLLSGGVFMLGGLYDFFTLPGQVEEANIRLDYRRALERRHGPEKAVDYDRQRWGERFRDEFNRDSPEKTILKAARKNNGVATPAAVALDGDLSIDEAKKLLDTMASRGYAEVKITRTGTMVYVFPEFISDPGKLDFEDI